MKEIKLVMTLFMLYVACGNVTAQTIARKSVSNAGGTLSGGGNIINFNIGEALIPTLTAGGSILTQGFEQPGEQIRTGTLVTTICTGMSISVPYTAIDLILGNTFTAQLSDASGNFASPVSIGTLSGYTSGTINATIPVGTLAGTGYRIRVVGDKPLTVGINNGVNIAINKPSLVAKCRNAVVVLSNAGNGAISPAGINNGSTDGGCGGALGFSLSKSSFNCSNLGANVVTLTVTNASMNSSTCTSIVTVKDLTKPVAKCKPASYAIGVGGTVIVPPSAINNSSTDACTSPPNLSLTPNMFTCANAGANTVTLTATDGSSNAGTCTAVVTVTCIGTVPHKVPEASAFADLVELMDLYPNPSTDQVTIRLNRIANADVPITIFDYSGKLVYHGRIFEGTTHLILDLNQLGMPSGVYMVAASFAKKVQVKPMTVFRD